MKATLNGKSRHVRISEVMICTIFLSPENEQLYRPVLSSDPEVIELAASIAEHGIREPLVITRDHYILSGHRRYVAAKRAGLAMVPCRIESIRRSDPEFLPLLREYNRQRIKTLDEIVREEVVSADPDEAYRDLVAHRKRQSRVTANTIKIEGTKRRARISPAKQPLLQAILRVLDEQRDFWPLTDRQIHYALLNDPPLRHASKPDSGYCNDRHSYQDCCDLLTRARLTGEIPWNAIADPTRPVATWNVYQSVAPFIREQLDGFLKDYCRDLQQSQPNHIEIVGEKNTIDNIVSPVAGEFCIPVTLGRGYCSLPPRYDMAQRFRRSGRERLIILVLSDFDPEGEDIAHSFARSMRDDFDIERIEPIKVALTAGQVRQLKLPHQGFKAKKKSSRCKKFVDRHGEHVYELEAVRPGTLQSMLRRAIDSVLDVKAFNAEVDAERRDAAKLDTIRKTLLEQMKGQLTEEP